MVLFYLLEVLPYFGKDSSTRLLKREEKRPRKNPQVDKWTGAKRVDEMDLVDDGTLMDAGLRKKLSVGGAIRFRPLPVHKSSCPLCPLSPRPLLLRVLPQKKTPTIVR